MTKLSPTMLEAFLRIARAGDGRYSRIGMPTLRALESRGLIEVTTWREASLTPHGRELAEAHAAYRRRRDDLLATLRVLSELDEELVGHAEQLVRDQLDLLEGPFYGSATDPAVVAVLGPPTVARS